MKIGLIYAMTGEIESLLTQEIAQPMEVASDVPFFRINGHIIACAGGVGKVNAAMATQLMIDRHRPDLIINAGVAGCFETLPIGQIVLADGFMQHDVDTTKVGDPPCFVSTVEQVIFPTDDLPRARVAMDQVGIPYRTGLVATGDWFATDCERARRIRDEFHPLLCEMEGCAVAQVCLRNSVKFMAVKSVSDCLFEHHDYYFNFPAAMKDLTRVVMAFIKNLEA